MEYLFVKNPLVLAEKPIFTNNFISKPEYKFNKCLFNLYSSSIIIPGDKNLNIEVVYKIIGYAEVANLIKILILCLLVYIILTAFFLLFVPYTKKELKPVIIGEKEKKDSADAVSSTVDVKAPEAVQPIKEQVAEAVQPAKEQTPEAIQPATEQAPDFGDIEPVKYTPMINEINKSDANKEPLDSIAANIKNDAMNASINIPGELDTISDNAVRIDPKTDLANNASINIPEELDTISDNAVRIDPKTGLANIEDFDPKLGYEIDKAAANDTDLSLLILSFASEDRSKITVLYDNLPLLLRNFFMSQMSFKLAENKLAIIIPDKSIEESIKKANEFIGRLKNISSIENIYAGISSRNSRIISAERLIKEAESAIMKANSGPEHIVAFKSDPEKFREMIARQNSL